MSEIMFSSDSMSKNIFSTAENTWMSTFVYNIIVLEWLENNGSKCENDRTFLLYHCWFQWISIVIYIQAILDLQNNLSFQETQQTNTTIGCHLKKNEFFIKRAVFPVKTSFLPLSYNINLGKVNAFILEQIRIVEFWPLIIIELTTCI